MVNRLVEPTAGQIFINGKEISGAKPEELRRSIGYAIQSVGLFPHMTVADNIAVVPELMHWTRDRIARRIDELLGLVGLNPLEYASKYPNQLSGGEAQRIGVARALAADLPILLMDEPFGAVDPLTREKLQAQFLCIQHELKKTVLLVTHDLDEAIRLADRIAIMASGRLVQHATPEEILSQPANKFVHDFVGTDRALKRLSRIGVSSFIRPVTSVGMSTPMKEAASACEQCRWVWVVEDDGRFAGWLDRTSLPEANSVRQAMVVGNIDEITINKRATLREALSRMLGQGINSIPVVDEGGHLIGEVTLGDVEAATAKMEP
jgi:osmoprotectant transport system ATP-binding protein